MVTAISSTTVQKPDGVLVALDIETAVLLAELHQIERSEVTGRVVEEHIFRARVRRLDLAGSRAGMPVIDGAVELDARVGAGPGGVAVCSHSSRAFSVLATAPFLRKI